VGNLAANVQGEPEAVSEKKCRFSEPLENSRIRRYKLSKALNISSGLALMNQI